MGANLLSSTSTDAETSVLNKWETNAIAILDVMPNCIQCAISFRDLTEQVKNTKMPWEIRFLNELCGIEIVKGILGISIQFFVIKINLLVL